MNTVAYPNTNDEESLVLYESNRSDNLQLLEQDLINLKQMFIDINHIIMSQSISLDLIESNANDTTEQVKLSIDELNSANNEQKKNYYLKTGTYILLGTLASTSLGGIGFFVGLKPLMIIAGSGLVGYGISAIVGLNDYMSYSK